MSSTSKVVWNEGLFLSPQLFQQQERYLESIIHARHATGSSFFWGMRQISINQEMLSLSRLSLNNASGVFQDGTTFDAPSSAALPAPLALTQSHVGQQIFLAIPVRSQDGSELCTDSTASHQERYINSEQEIFDLHTPAQPSRSIQLAKLQLYLLPSAEMNSRWVGFPVAHVHAVHSDHTAELTAEFLPPLLHLDASLTLMSRMRTLFELIQIRASQVAEHMTNANRKATSPTEITDYFLLQLLNRHEAWLTHYLDHTVTPEYLYLQLRMLAAELATFTHSSARYVHAPDYRHLDPLGTFTPLLRDIHAMLNEVMVRSAQRIDLQLRQHGVRLADVSAATLQTYRTLVIAISASLPADTLAQQFSARCKAGPADKLPELIRSHMPGIPLIPLPVPPRQIPYHNGFTYFAFDNKGPMWEHVMRHGGLSMHIAGDFPDLQVELWAIRDNDQTSTGT